jgi:hypothetical protein
LRSSIRSELSNWIFDMTTSPKLYLTTIGGRPL